MTSGHSPSNAVSTIKFWKLQRQGESDKSFSGFHTFFLICLVEGNLILNWLQKMDNQSSVTEKAFVL